jgi:NADPH:quinone reductase-like Zn-dependent oxidoreductase
MRVMVLHDFNGPDRFRVEQRPRPVPDPTEVLVAVTATGINPVEWGASAGGWLATLHGGPPLHLGWDVAGRVVEVGYGVTRLRPGDEVFGMPRFPHPAGSYAEYVTAPSRHFVPKPAGISHVEAAGLPLAGLTAWQALVDTAGVQAGHRVLVTAAAGGVGHIAVQIAKARGAFVIGTARRANHAFIRENGVNRCIDYTEEDLVVAGPVKVIIDLAGGPGLAELPALLAPGGVLVSVTGELPPTAAQAARQRGARAVEFLVEPDAGGLQEIVDLVDQGRLRVHVDKVFPVVQVATAHDLGREGHTRGKLVLDVAGTWGTDDSAPPRRNGQSD